MSQLLKNWTPGQFETLEEGVLLANHNLAETGLFSDEALVEILDSHPEDFLTISTMGNDTNVFEWREGYRDGVAAEELIRLVREGHLWMNVRRIMDFQPKHAKLVHDLYSELEQGNGRFRAIQRSANLLISSPRVLVHYHVDLPVNMLWHIRGRKRVWVYPHFDHRFVSKEVMENVAVGNLTEDVPYHAALDQYALSYDVEPGQLLTWPQHSPHRVNNIEGINVSLSTEHMNARAIRRNNMYEANHYLRNWFGVANPNTNVSSFSAHVKQNFARGVRFTSKFFAKPKRQFEYGKAFVVDPAQPTGVRWLNECDDSFVPHKDFDLVHA